MKNLNRKYIFVLVFCSLFGPVINAINTVPTGFKVVQDQLQTIVAHGVCKKVWNSGASPQFIATKTFLEWSSFYSNIPTDIVVRDCMASCSNLYKMGVTSSGVYSLDIDGPGPLSAQNIYCDQSNDGGGWTRVFKHNISAGYFTDNTDAALSNQTDPNNTKYSILDLLNNFKSMNRFTFKLIWPEVTEKNIWSQQTNPTYFTGIKGYRGISIDSSVNFWGGLEFSDNVSSFIDGSVEHSNWYYAIGSTAAWSDGIPSSHSISTTGLNEVQLYIHDSGLHPMSCEHISELGESKGSGVYTIYPDQVTPIDVYCDMELDSGGWTLFYANAADATITTKKSYQEHLTDLNGIAINSSNFNDAQTVGMINFNDFAATQIYAKDVGNWGPSEFSRVDFFNSNDLRSVITEKFGPTSTVTDDCNILQSGSIFRFSNSNGQSYYMDRALNYNGFGWGDCLTRDQTNNSDVENFPRHFIYNTTGSSDSTRVRGVGGFNNGDATVKARYFLREKYDQPKNCMDILLNGNSKGNGTYTIYPNGIAISVECDMRSHGGGWTKIWHGYPSHAARNETSSEIYSRSNSISFNQMRMVGVNIDVDIVDSTWETAYLNKTIPEYYNQLYSEPDGNSPRVKFANADSVEDVGLVGGYFMRGYGNYWRIFYTCINVGNTDDYIYVSGSYVPRCPARDTFVPSSISTCTNSGNNYCTNSFLSTEVDSGLGLTLKEYQETAVWVRSLPSMRSCRDILDAGYSSGNGVYLIDVDGPEGDTAPLTTYCEMENYGGGWTLVWSNTKGGTNKPTTDLTYAESINTIPRCSRSNESAFDFSGDCIVYFDGSMTSRNENEFIDNFNYFLGLKHWNSIASGEDFQLLQKWSSDYNRLADYAAVMNVKSMNTSDYTLDIKSYSNLVGSVDSGLYTYHNGLPWSAKDVDNDNSPGSCGTNYSNTPFWYNSCWDGSMNGGGELLGNGYYNGAYWTGSAKQDGDPATGDGAGNGWLFVREHKRSGRLKSSCKEILNENPNAPSGNYTIDYTAGSLGDQKVVYCDMDTNGGGWTLVAYSNGTATATIANDFMVNSYAVSYIYDHNRVDYSSSINPEEFSLAVGTEDAMFISPDYNGGAAYVDTGFGLWNYDVEKCTGVLRHTSRTAGCAGQNANDNYNSSDQFNIGLEGGNEGIVPAYKATEVCYSGKGSFNFKFFSR